MSAVAVVTAVMAPGLRDPAHPKGNTVPVTTTIQRKPLTAALSDRDSVRKYRMRHTVTTMVATVLADISRRPINMRFFGA
jgi:hypothetical protein